MALTVEEMRRMVGSLAVAIDDLEDEIEDADTELEDVIELLRKHSVRAMQWGREGDMQLLDGIIEELKRHEHRR